MKSRSPELWEALLSLIASALLISLGLIGSKGELPVPILLLLALIPPTLMGLRLGLPWAELEEGMVKGMSLALKAMAILMVVGVTIAAWAASGTIAILIDYGLAVLSPAGFLPLSLIICALISLAIGSSWATAATAGVALMGVGTALGIPPGMSAGAVLSGSYFGDKMSPLSDTTNLAAGIVEVPLFEHIRAMIYTTLPATLLALLGFGIMGALESSSGGFDASRVEALGLALNQHQTLSFWLLLPPLLVIGLALLRFPALPALLLGSLAGVILALLFQGADFQSLLASLYSGFKAQSSDAAVNKLLSRGGIASMHDTISLILVATALGGVLERTGVVAVLLKALLKRVRSTAGLISATVFSGIGVNFLMADQYLSIVLPGRMYREAYQRKGIKGAVLSRTLEDAGTVTSALCPWNSGGAYMAATLGVSTLAYLPYAFFNLLMPLIALSYAWLGLFIWRERLEDGPENQP